MLQTFDKDIKIAIIGGGLSGFAVAIMLQNLGYHKVNVYERDSCLSQRRQGYGLTILQGITALKALGSKCFERVKNLDTPSRSHYIFDNVGNIINFFGTIFWTTAANKTPLSTPKKNKKYNLHISRTNLRKILYEELLKKSDCVQWDHHLKLIQTSQNQRLNLNFSNGLFTEVDLVIGCDGINTITRKFKYLPTIDYPLNYLGMILILGITNCDHPLAHQRVFQTVDGCTRLFAMPYANHESKQNIMWQLSFPLSEIEAKHLSTNLKLLKEHISERCGNWHEPVPSMIRNTDLSLIMGIPAYDRETNLPDHNFIENIVLLGDAAHPMSPFKGQGANQALLDAVSFANCLPTCETIQDAISKYEIEMIKRVGPKVALSRERVPIFHDPNILNSESFEYRCSDKQLLNNLKKKNINSQSGENIETFIMNEMTFAA